MTIRQYKAKGPFMDTILQVVALDDAVSLIAFSVCAAFVQASSSNGSVTVSQIAFPVLFNFWPWRWEDYPVCAQQADTQTPQQGPQPGSGLCHHYGRGRNLYFP